MACTGCDARMEWAKRKAHLAAQTIAALLKRTPAHDQTQAHDTEEQPAADAGPDGQDVGDDSRGD